MGSICQDKHEVSSCSPGQCSHIPPCGDENVSKTEMWILKSKWEQDATGWKGKLASREEKKKKTIRKRVDLMSAEETECSQTFKLKCWAYVDSLLPVVEGADVLMKILKGPLQEIPSPFTFYRHFYITVSWKKSISVPVFKISSRCYFQIPILTANC